MPRYSYSAYDTAGAKVAGALESQDLEGAKEKLNSLNLVVISLGIEGGDSNGLSLLARRRVSGEEIEYLTAELALLLRSGVTIDNGLGILRRNSSSVPQAKLIGQLHDAVRSGRSLADAMADHKAIFNVLYLNLVKLGEASGNLPAVFARLAKDLLFQRELKGKVGQALIYPGVIFIVCVLCVLFVFNYIVPQMSGLFAGIPEIPYYTSILLALSDWMIKYQWYAFLGLACFVGAIVAYGRNPVGAGKLDSFAILIPGVSSLITRLERIRFNTAVAMMLESGIKIDRCLEMALGSVKNSEIRQGLTAAKDRVKKGMSLSVALRTSSIYDDFSMSLVEVGEESGELASVFQEISSRARRDFESSIEKMTSLVEPLLILIMGGIVGGVVVVMLLSIVSVNDVGL